MHKAQHFLLLIDTLFRHFHYNEKVKCSAEFKKDYFLLCSDEVKQTL